MDLTRDAVTQSLRTFTARRDSLLHEDVATFDHHFDRFLEYCRTDPLAQRVLASIEGRSTLDLNAWWSSATAYGQPKVSFPNDPDEECSLRYQILQSTLAGPNRIMSLGLAHDQRKTADSVEVYRTLIVRPFVDDLSRRLAAAANLATPEARATQAVPYHWIPAPSEAKVFLSHKSIDKPMVMRYYHALKTLGFDPWLDEASMHVGANLERELLRGFDESCAAVFFITENFTDERYLATEVEYAILQKRKKEKKFAIVALRYSSTTSVPSLLTPYIYKDVVNDLDGFHALLKALPIELGPIRWKADVL